MTWNLNGKEFESVIHLDPERRFEYFIKRVADWKEIWSLWKEGWVLMGDKEGNELVPVWPHPVYAEAYAHGEWFGYVARKIDLQDWLDKWIPGMEKDGRMVAVFPTTEGQSSVIKPNRLKEDLQQELSKYE